jgi:hypothetical protein
MQPGARFFVAHTNTHLNFRLEHLFDGFQLGINDRVFYENRIIHANAGESFRLYRADGATQDSLRYDGTTGPRPRLEAPNTTGTPGRQCLSIQRHNITVDENGIIIFNRSDWHSSKPVALEHFPTSPLTVNGEPIPKLPTPPSHFADGVSVMVDGRVVQRSSNRFFVLLDGEQSQVNVTVVAPTSAIKIENITQSSAIIDLLAYGNNNVDITITPQGESPQFYTLNIIRPISFEQVAVLVGGSVLVVLDPPGKTFTTFRWFRNGQLIGTDRVLFAGTNGEQFNPNDVYYVELTAEGVDGAIPSRTSRIALQ